MPRRPEIGNIQLYPDRPLRKSDRNGYVLKFYCPIQRKRIRRNCGTRDRREARKVLRECRERLLNGKYVESNGAISAGLTLPGRQRTDTIPDGRVSDGLSWQDCYDRYRSSRRPRMRDTSFQETCARLCLVERIFEMNRLTTGVSEGWPIVEVMTTEMLEFLQLRLLAGDAGRFEVRAPTSVNSFMASVMAFVRFCFARGWIAVVPHVDKLPVDEVMKGRPISEEEFKQMLAATSKVVGKESVPSWEFLLRVIWESGFRVGDVMDFHWHDERHIHPVWGQDGQSDVLVVPSSQKNGRLQQIPLLSGLKAVVGTIPRAHRLNWVVNPAPTDSRLRRSDDWFRPTDEDLAEMIQRFSNCEIARSCGVSDTAVRKWMSSAGLSRQSTAAIKRNRIPDVELSACRKRSSSSPIRTGRRMTVERVGRVISKIGREAGIVVRQADERTGKKLKYASAPDLRRGFALRLINAGVSAETLKLMMRHESFVTTERYYGAVRSAQVAGNEIAACLAAAQKPPFVGGLMGGPPDKSRLTSDEVKALKSLLAKL